MAIQSVLVVDNDPGVLTFMTMLLEKNGLEVRTAGDGLHALTVLEEFEPDVMFIDLIMPNISGDKLCQVLRSQRRFDRTYLIVLSAISSEEDLNYAEIGFDACIAKGPLKSVGELVMSVIGKLGTRITRENPGSIYGLENLYKREITRELLSTKRHFELILENMSEGIIETTGDGKIVFANSSAARFLGIPEEILLSGHLADLFDPEQRKMVLARQEAALAAEPTTTITFVHNKQTISFQSLLVVDQKTRSVMNIVEDVTEKQRARDELESQVRNRTAELEKEIEKRRLLEMQLRASLKEKEAMLGEIHHRVKNNLQIVSSLLGLGAGQIEGEKSRRVLEDMKRRVHSLALVHDRLYRSGDLANVKAEEYFRSLVHDLLRSLASEQTVIKAEVHAEAIVLPLELAVPCAIITNELITNSLKHAFGGKRSGTVFVLLEKVDNTLFRLTIGDDGVGVAGSIDPTTSGNFGFRIVRVLARQIRATLTIQRHNGTRFVFDIPIRRQE